MLVFKEKTTQSDETKKHSSLSLLRSMALEFSLEVRCPNAKVTVIGTNPTRRELVLGFEDGSVQTYDNETGSIVTFLLTLYLRKRIFSLSLCPSVYAGDMTKHCYKHRGWVTALCALPEARAFFSSGNDSTIVTYNGKNHQSQTNAP